MPLAVTKPLAVRGAVEAKMVAALAVMVPPAAKGVATYTARVVLLPLVPNSELYNARNAALTGIAALAVMGAVEVKVVAALTVRVWLLLVPSTVLPAIVKVMLVLLRATPAVET